MSGGKGGVKGSHFYIVRLELSLCKCLSRVKNNRRTAPVTTSCHPNKFFETSQGCQSRLQPEILRGKELLTVQELPDDQGPEPRQGADGVKYAFPPEPVQHQRPHPTCQQRPASRGGQKSTGPHGLSLRAHEFGRSPKMAAAVHGAH